MRNSQLVRNMAFSAAAVCAAVSAVACGTDEAPTTLTPAPRETVTVLAASSLAAVLPEIEDAYRLASGGRAVFSFGASGTLATQVKNGAPADIVIFAGSAPMDSLDEDRLIQPGSRRGILTNTLVVIVSSESDMRLESLAEIADNSTGKIAIADPSLAPAGQYAQAAMETAGIWDRVSPRVVPTLDVRAAAAAVASGNAEIAFVYATDALVSDAVRVLFELPADTYPEISYPAAAIANSDRLDVAGEFLDFLISPTARAIFTKYGFTPRG